jgi:hypothetical protein
MNRLELNVFATRIARSLSKFHIEAGDILIVKDYEAMGVLCAMPLPGIPQCPIIYAPDGLDKVDIETLRTVLAAAEQLQRDRTALKTENQEPSKEPSDAPPTVN